MRRHLTGVVFGTFVGLLLVVLLEAGARLAYQVRDYVRGGPPTVRLQDYHVLDEQTRGHWTLQPGYVRTVSQAIGDKESDGRVRGAEHLSVAVQQGHISDAEIFIRINQRGFRGPEIDDAHSTPRILTIGDSCTFGTVEAHTYPNTLQRELVLHGRVAEVVNGGVEGYTPRNVLLRMRDYQLLEPELVTVYIGWNALFDEVSTFGERVTVTLESARLLQQVFAWASGQSHTQRAAVAALGRKPDMDPHDPMLDTVRQFVPHFFDEVVTIARQLRASGSRVYLITLPGLFTENPPPSPEAVRVGHLPLYTRNPLVLARLTANYNDAIRAFAAREQFDLIDLAKWSEQALQPRHRYFFDSVHLYEEGQRMIGRELAAQLRPAVEALARRRGGS